MNTRRAQRGISILNLIFLAALAGFAVVIGLKLIPMYAESFKIDAALQNLISQDGISERSKDEIARDLIRHLDIDNVTRFTKRNYSKEGLKITKRKNSVTIEVLYRAEAPLVGNLTLVADFHKKVQN